MDRKLALKRVEMLEAVANGAMMVTFNPMQGGERRRWKITDGVDSERMVMDEPVVCVSVWGMDKIEDGMVYDLVPRWRCQSDLPEVDPYVKGNESGIGCDVPPVVDREMHCEDVPVTGPEVIQRPRSLEEIGGYVARLGKAMQELRANRSKVTGKSF